MLSTWAKRLVPAPVATGAVCLTMHLTNQQKTMLDSLSLIQLDQKPNIDEKELVPQVKVTPKQNSNTPTNDSEDDNSQQSQKQQSDDSNKKDQKQDSNSNQKSQQKSIQQDSDDSDSSDSSKGSSQTMDQQTDIDIKDVIKQLIVEINDKQSNWIQDPKSLSSIHEMSSRVNKLTDALKTFKSTTS